MNENKTFDSWSDNVILADADYIDRVAFDLTVNFERMLERRIPKADLARWIDCVALDGGCMPPSHPQGKGEGEQEIRVILLHSKDKLQLDNFVPANFAQDLDGKAFRDNLGEFCISCVQVEELTTMEDLFAESLKHICQQPDVKRLMIIGDEQYYNRIKLTLQEQGTSGKEQYTVFTMQPMPGSRFQQQILGFSLMAALGIKGEELK